MKLMLERVVDLTVNGKTMPSFLCTPDALDEMAVGYLLTQGHIDSASQIDSVSVRDLSVFVRTRSPIRPLLPIQARIESLRPVAEREAPSNEEILLIMQKLLSQETFYGTHAIALKTPVELIVREDIGRHNALDKIVGCGALRGVDFSRCIVAATGRISLEMLMKVASVGVPVLLTKKYPSDLSAEIAGRIGLRIIGHASTSDPIPYGYGAAENA